MLRKGPDIRNKMVRFCEFRDIVLRNWCRASELLLALPFSKRGDLAGSVPVLDFSTSTPAKSKSHEISLSFSNAPSPLPAQAARQNSTHSGAPIASIGAHAPTPRRRDNDLHVAEKELERRDADMLNAARSFIESKEFARAIHVLKDARSGKANFIRVYSKFMVRLPSGVQYVKSVIRVLPLG
jgi:anaphase-promoting complex subunit 8